VAGISISISGGGHRAALFGLGALLYLADAGKNRDVSSIASVSGGSLTNGHLAQTLDYANASSDEVRTWAAAPAKRFARNGTLWGTPITWFYLAGLVVFALAVNVGIWFLPVQIWIRVVLFVAGLLALALFAELRGAVCGRAFAKTLFTKPGRHRPTRLCELHSTIDHVICATDLHAGEHVYFSGRFVCAYRFGFGEPRDLPLHTAVQASAAFPGGFPARWLRTARHRFKEAQDEKAAGARSLVLADGGVYDNMGDQWAQGIGKRKARWGALAAALHEPDELIVVNASAGLRFKPTWALRLPLIGELLTLVRDKDVLYDNGTSVRRAALVARFLLSELQGSGLRGALVHIEQSPYKVPQAYENDKENTTRANRARAALFALDSKEEEWKTIADKNSRVGTVLTSLGVEVSARLLHHAYVLAMINLHVLLNYPLLTIPDRAQFAKLVS
jgi:predicted acylesterase/phospholipase RssA